MSEAANPLQLSALVVARNEEEILHECLKRLRFADELVVVLDRCTDGSKAIADAYADVVLEVEAIVADLQIIIMPFYRWAR